MITLATLSEYLRKNPGTRGSRLARIILDRADPKAENWFESASRWWMLEAGLPKPFLQVPFTDDSGRVQARVDMLFADHWTVGEADGRGKYDAPGALFAEKLREDWLRSQKRLEVVRWTPRELRTLASRSSWINRLLDAFARAGHP